MSEPTRAEVCIVAGADPDEWRRFAEQYLADDEAAYQKAVQG